MTPEAQRIAIAEACEWKLIRMEEEGRGRIVYPSGFGIVFSPEEWACKRFLGLIPDYLNDLNAMHEAEEVLSASQLVDYWGELMELGLPNVWIIHATAAQRAEAFLRTIGKWAQEI